MPACSQRRSSQRWQEVKSTGVPSVRFIASRVTCALPQAAQTTPERFSVCVSEPSGMLSRAARPRRPRVAVTVEVSDVEVERPTGASGCSGAGARPVGGISEHLSRRREQANP